MQFLVTNDDGFDAPGIATLAELLQDFGAVTVVAPRDHHSGCGHRVTDDRPLRVTSIAEGWYAVDGTPADCTRLGLLHLAPEADWVLSGINAGGNLGIDLFMSGTVAAAREAVFFGRPAAAISQFFRSRVSDWPASARAARRALEILLHEPLPPRTFWNVNLPHPDPAGDEPEIVRCEPDFSHHHVQYEESADGYIYRGVYQERPRVAGGDIDACFSGRIAVSQVALFL